MPAPPGSFRFQQERWYNIGNDRSVPAVSTRLNRLHKRQLERWIRRDQLVRLSQRPDLIMLLQSGDADAVLKELDNSSSPAANKGTAVHAGISLMETTGCGIEQTPPQLSYWLRSYLDLKEQERFCCELSEQVVYNDIYGYAGQFDGAYSFLTGSPYGLLIGDTKTGGLWVEAALQIAAYANATHFLDGRPMPDNIRRDVGMVIHLPDQGQGQPALHFVNLARPWALFKALCFLDDGMRTLEPDVWGEVLTLSHVPGQGDLTALLAASIEQANQR